MLETIKSSTDISHLFSQGRRLDTPYLTFIVLNHEQHDRDGRVAFIAGKKLGNAVWRNRAKRRMRAVSHDLGINWTHCDVIFLAKKRITQANYSKVLKACESTLAEAGLHTLPRQ